MDYDALLDAIYEAGADSSRWQYALALLTTKFRGVCAAMHVGDTNSEFSFGATYQLDPDAARAYADYYFAINPLNAPLTTIATGGAVGDAELVPRAAYHAGEFYNDYSLRFGLNGSVTAILDNKGGQVSCLGVVTPTNSEPHSPTEIAAFQRLVPHLRRAVELNRNAAALKAKAEAAENALDLLDFGIVLVGDRGTVLRVNAAAEAMITRENGLQIFAGVLRALDSSSQQKLSYLIHCAATGQGPRGGSLHIPTLNGTQPIFARVLPYSGSAYDGVPNVRALVYLRDPKMPMTTGSEQIGSAYGLTSAECRVLAALVDEPDVSILAERFGVTVVTVRNQVARILAKTGTSKQSELIRLVLSARLPIRNQQNGG